MEAKATAPHLALLKRWPSDESLPQHALFELTKPQKVASAVETLLLAHNALNKAQLTRIAALIHKLCGPASSLTPEKMLQNLSWPGSEMYAAVRPSLHFRLLLLINKQHPFDFESVDSFVDFAERQLAVLYTALAALIKFVLMNDEGGRLDSRAWGRLERMGDSRA